MDGNYDIIPCGGDSGFASPRKLLCDEAVSSNDGFGERQQGVFKGVLVPMVGMLFDDVISMFEIYKRYGERVGFSVRKRTVNKDDDGAEKYVTLVCGKADKYRSKSKKAINPRPSAKFGCKARIRARCNSDGKWEITAFEDGHNHDMSPTKSRYFVCNREINSHVKRQIEINDIAGIRASKSHNALVIGAGGHERLCFLEKDTRNLIAKQRRLRLGVGDAEAVQEYFLKMQAQNDGFFSSIDWDEKGRLRNVFWADPRSRAACREFGDVISFDTTYLTNKYDMPFAPFVGVNHHGESILLGCALISSEDTDTFVWLFKTWLACMNNVAPDGIITDQDRAMKNAISIVFPNTRHRLCLWHIMKKVPEKLGSYKEYDNITYALGAAVYESQSIEEFESAWMSMIEVFKLQDNAWLASMYELRESWVPIYVKKSFWAGMSTTQRSESMNAFFDGYVNSKTTLKQFVEQYNNALRKKIEKESQSDFNSFHKLLDCATIFDMEKQMRDLYTEAKFKEFRGELSGMITCYNTRVVESSHDFEKYLVEEYMVYGEKGKKKVDFTVCYEAMTSTVECSCFRFEFRGILCRHAMAVLIRNENDFMPEQYIFKRWRKDVRRCHTRVKICYDGWLITEAQRRYDILCQSFTKVADLAAENEELFNNISQWMEVAIDSMENDNIIPSLPPGSSSNDPISKRGKGRPPTVRKQKIFKRRGSAGRKGSNVTESPAECSSVNPD